MEPNISSVKPTDNYLYRGFFERDGIRYGNSWYYVTQAAHNARGRNGAYNLGKKYYDGETLITIGEFGKPGTGQFGTAEFPSMQERAVHLIRPLGKDAAEKAVELAKRYRGRHVYVKNITPEQKNYLVANGFHPIEYFPWHPEAPKEDSTFDGQIIDPRMTFAGLHHTPIKRKLFSFASARRFRNIDVPESAEDAKRLVDNFFRKEERRKFSYPDDYYNMLRYPPFGKIGKDYFAYVVYASEHLAERGFNDVPVGFVAAERIGPEDLGVYANIADYENFPGSSEYLIADLCKNAINQWGIRRIHLGGSETQGLWRFKEKFIPVAHEHVEWVVKPAFA